MYRIHFPEIPNMGDLLNKNMLEELFHIKVESVPALKSNLSAIGSGLSAVTWSSKPSTRIKQISYYPFAPHNHYVWGTGFIYYNNKVDPQFYFKHMNICSVRGNLTKKRIETMLGKSLEIPTGDGGLLAEQWVGRIPKKYSIGIIPHFKEKDHPILNEMNNYYRNSIVIDLTEEPKEVIKKIASCEVVLSSSLHGLIISDSYNIPNLHIQLFPYGTRMMGDGFKFDDYYSSYGLTDNAFQIVDSTFPSIEDIHNRYLVKYSDVEIKKEQIYNVFPKI